MSQTDQRAVCLQRAAVHEASHAVACLALGIEVAAIWVRGVTKSTDLRIFTRPPSDEGGVIHKDSGPWESLVSVLSGVAGELIDQNLPAEFAFALPEFSEGGYSDFNFAREDARKVIISRGGEATSEAIFDVIEDGYAAAFELLTRHRSVIEQIVSAVLTSGLLTGDEIQQLWNGVTTEQSVGRANETQIIQRVQAKRVGVADGRTGQLL
jgi:hypothetical protein